MNKLLKIQAKALAITIILLISIPGMLLAQKIAIIDAGSSGSRLYVYEIANKGKKIDVLYPTVGQETKSKGRALSSVPNHSDSVKVFLTTMTSKYNQGSTTENIPLYILATAGMRMESKGKADSIYARIYQIANKEILNGFHLEKAMTISGRYEGFYAWIAANYKNGKLEVNNSSSEKPMNCINNSYGILEIGGASMQIAFAANKPDANYISRKGVGYIYSKSYLGGGVDQIFEKNRVKIAPDFNIELKDISHLPINASHFIGLGKPIEIVLDGAKSKDISIKDYPKSLTIKQEDDSMKNYHPWINAQYISYVVDFFKLDGKLNKPTIKSDWTEGAALDIIINKEEPEAFNYKERN